MRFSCRGNGLMAHVGQRSKVKYAIFPGSRTVKKKKKKHFMLRGLLMLPTLFAISGLEIQGVCYYHCPYTLPLTGSLIVLCSLHLYKDRSRQAKYKVILMIWQRLNPHCTAVYTTPCCQKHHICKLMPLALT